MEHRFQPLLGIELRDESSRSASSAWRAVIDRPGRHPSSALEYRNRVEVDCGTPASNAALALEGGGRDIINADRSSSTTVRRGALDNSRPALDVRRLTQNQRRLSFGVQGRSIAQQSRMSGRASSLLLGIKPIVSHEARLSSACGRRFANRAIRCCRERGAHWLHVRTITQSPLARTLRSAGRLPRHEKLPTSTSARAYRHRAPPAPPV